MFVCRWQQQIYMLIETHRRCNGHSLHIAVFYGSYIIYVCICICICCNCDVVIFYKRHYCTGVMYCSYLNPWRWQITAETCRSIQTCVWLLSVLCAHVAVCNCHEPRSTGLNQFAHGRPAARTAAPSLLSGFKNVSCRRLQRLCSDSTKQHEVSDTGVLSRCASGAAHTLCRSSPVLLINTLELLSACRSIPSSQAGAPVLQQLAVLDFLSMTVTWLWGRGETARRAACVCTAWPVVKIVVG